MFGVPVDKRHLENLCWSGGKNIYTNYHVHVFLFWVMFARNCEFAWSRQSVAIRKSYNESIAPMENLVMAGRLEYFLILFSLHLTFAESGQQGSISFTDSWNAGGSLPEQCATCHQTLGK